MALAYRNLYKKYCFTAEEIFFRCFCLQIKTTAKGEFRCCARGRLFCFVCFVDAHGVGVYPHFVLLVGEIVVAELILVIK